MKKSENKATCKKFLLVRNELLQILQQLLEMEVKNAKNDR